MENDRAFAAYAWVLLGGIGSLITALVAAGVGSLPDPLWLFAHVSMSVLMRASYKSIAGWDASEWTLTVARPGRGVAPERLASLRGATGADA